MPLRSPWFVLVSVLVFVAACVASAPLRADDSADIEQLFHDGKPDAALAKADALIAAEPRVAGIRFLKGVMLMDLRRNEEAMQVFTALTQDYPDLADPYNNLAVLYASKGQLPNALAALQSALRNDPHHRAALENLGDVHLALAQQAWAAAQAESKGDDAALVRKLRLAREILPESAPAPVLKHQAAPPSRTPGSPLRGSQGLDSAGRRTTP